MKKSEAASVGGLFLFFYYNRDVSYWPKADITVASTDVRFRGQSGHRALVSPCPLLTHSGSRVPEFAVVHNLALLTDTVVG
jgi:hypothetical protein